MKPKDYLMQYRESMERTKEINQHLAELKAEAVQLTDHKGRSVSLDGAVAKYIDACDQSGAELNRLAAIREEIIETIDSVPVKKYRELLREVYINGKKLVRIAADRDQCYEHICRLHGEALRMVSVPEL